MDPWWWLGLFVLVAYTTEAAIGFGSIVIALSLGALLLPIDALLPVLVPLNICMTGYLVARHHRQIHLPTLLRLILPLMAAGTLTGYALRPWLGETAMQLLFGGLILWFAGRELWRAWRGLHPRPHGRWWTRSWMFTAGITHGLFASGGPLLVYSLTGVQLPKAEFRATLVTVWLSLNSLLTVVFALDGSLLPSLPKVGALLPVLIVGVLTGEWLHHRVNEERFRRVVFLLLFITGLLLISATVRTTPDNTAPVEGQAIGELHQR